MAQEIKITADTREAQRKIEDLGKALGNVEKAGDLAGKGLAAITAATAAAGIAISNAIQNVSALNDMSKALNMSAQNLKYLQQSAILAGVGAEELNSSLIRLQGNIGDAIVKGTGPAATAFERMGIEIEKVQALSPDKQLELISQSLLKIPDPAERSALAIDLLGRQGPRLLEAAAAMEQVKKRTEDLGLALSDIDVEAIDRAGDKVDELKFLFQAGLEKAVAKIAPYIIVIVDKIEQAVEKAGGFEQVWANIITGIKNAISVAVVFVNIWIAAKLYTIVMSVVGAMGAMYNAIKAATGAAMILNSVMGKNPILKIAAALVAIGSTAFALSELNDLFADLDSSAADASAKITADVEKRKLLEEQQVPLKKTLNEEQKKALLALDENIKKLENALSFEKDKIALGTTEATIRRTIAEEEAKLAKQKLIMKDADKERIRNAIQETIAIQNKANWTNQILKSEGELKNLGIQSLDAREEENAVLAEKIRLGKDFTAEIEKQVRENVKNLQQNREQLEIEKQRALLKGLPTNQTKAQQIATATGVIGKLDPRLSAEQQYQTEKKALQDAADISDAQRKIYLEQLEKQHQDKLHQIKKDKMLEDMRMSGVTNQAILDATSKSMDNIRNIQKGGVDAMRGTFDQFGLIINSLGTHNKKAFEAAKKFNIANAIINTALAATQALKTLPPPFSFIAAAAQVAAGMAQVAVIRNQQYSGRALGGPVMGGETYMVGENGPELFTPNTTGSITRNQDIGGGDNVNINFNINTVDAKGFDNLLATRKPMIIQMVRTAMNDRGNRSLV